MIRAVKIAVRWTYYSFVLMVLSLQAGEIITTSNFGRIEEEVEKLDNNSLVLFDVDATLIVPDDAILKPQAKNIFKYLIAGHLDRDLFRDIRLKASHSLVDPRSIALVQNLQEKKISVLAFTAAPAKIRGVEQPGDWRIDELQRYGFNFSLCCPICGVLEIPKSADQQHFPMFKSGVLFSSFHPKGDILVVFLQITGLDPKKVVFVDDELEHVQSVITCLEKCGVDCIGIHYTAANEAPCDLKLEQARFQVNYFIQHDIWLSDNESDKLFLSIE